MAMRRARIKMAPNLALTRNKNKAVPESPKIVIKSDTENSESEPPFSDHDDIHERMTDIVPKSNIVETIKKQIVAPMESVPKINGAFLPDCNQAFKPIEITPVEEPKIADLPDTTTADIEDPPITNGIHGDLETSTKMDIQDRVVTNGLEAKNKVRVPSGRNKFRPNLNFDRSRHGSGPGPGPGPLSPRPRPPTPQTSSPMGTRSRTISSSSTNSESDVVLNNKNPGPRVDSPILRAAITQPKPARIRRTTESRSTLGDSRTQFLRRKLDHKRKFSGGIPDRGSLTMFDLIYYNPTHGQRMSVEDEEGERADDPDNDLGDAAGAGNIRLGKTEAEGDIQLEEEDRSEAIPVPQVKVGVNGEIIVDEASLQVETTQAKEAKIMMKNSTLVFENNKTSNNYGRWSKKRRHNDWTPKETVKFYKALAIVGSDFSLMENIFKKRTRNELKLKFKKEERINNEMVEKCLKEPGKYADLESLMRESNEEDDEDEYGSRGRSRKPKKKRARRRYVNRGYYASSSDGEEADVEASKSPVRKGLVSIDHGPSVSRIKKPLVVNGRTNVVQATNGDESFVEIIEPPLAANLNQSHAGVQFPPGLLAANPSLAGAKPGSLVVVASPHKPDNPLLSVFMVPEKTHNLQPPPGPKSPHPAVLPMTSELRLDPAVIRAVDRGRVHRQRTMSDSDQVASKMAASVVRTGRKRTLSEMETVVNGDDGVTGRVRQRTCSESGIESNKKRFLSGNGR